MIDRIGDIYKRMEEIQSLPKRIQNEKPEIVKSFHDMYMEAMKDFANDSGVEDVKTINSTTSTQDTVNINDSESTSSNEKLMMNRKEINSAIDEAISGASSKYQVAKDLISAIIKVESNFNPGSVSKAGAMGLMQLMPATAKELGVIRPFDISQNIDGGTKYLRYLLERYNGDLDKALAAYNAGPSRVDAAGGIPQIDETRNYVEKVKTILYGEGDS